MNFEHHIQKRITQAEAVLRRCIGKNGVYASPGFLKYKFQDFTRDTEEALNAYLLLGERAIVHTHLDTLAGRQWDDGSIDELFSDNDDMLLLQKAVRACTDPRRLVNFQNHLPRLRQSIARRLPFIPKPEPQAAPTVDPFHNWTATTDKDLCYVLALAAYEKATGDTSISDTHPCTKERALAFTERENVQDGLYYGGDWRDNVYELKDHATCSNNVRYIAAREKLYGRDQTARALFHSTFWNKDKRYFIDHTDVDTFDTYGNALAVLHGIAYKDQYKGIIAQMELMRTKWGMIANELIMPNDASKKQRDANAIVNQYRKIWYHVHGKAILALIEMGATELAQEQFAVWTNLTDDFEWRDPKNGKAGGAKDQMWNSALYYECAHRLGYVR